MAIKALGVKVDAFTAAATWYTKKHKIVRPRRGFYLILPPEDKVAGAPDPARWIDPLMKIPAAGLSREDERSNG